MLEKLNRINLLCDIYASLLTERQQEVLRLYFSDNCSLGEIASSLCISRQAVHDLIRRALASIESLESKLGLYAFFNYQQERLDEAGRLLEPDCPGQTELNRLRRIVEELRSKNEQ